jgi:hypothetical protein
LTNRASANTKGATSAYVSSANQCRGAISICAVSAISELRDWSQIVPLPRGPAAAETCAGAYPLALLGTAQASRRSRPVSS